MLPDYYEILQVSPNAEVDVIRAAYTCQLRRIGPVDCPDKEIACRLLQLQEAYAVLTDPHRRAAYDLRRAEAADGAYSDWPAHADTVFVMNTAPI